MARTIAFETSMATEDTGAIVCSLLQIMHSQSTDQKHLCPVPVVNPVPDFSEGEVSVAILPFGGGCVVCLWVWFGCSATFCGLLVSIVILSLTSRKVKVIDARHLSALYGP
ncbi:hypothetical protein J6590_038702 [Homalodisca vitripennis]|nr:hypothetical protein J6590_038702 [Homalodisca vitripennis]